jgi:hypothetical protein
MCQPFVSFTGGSDSYHPLHCQPSSHCTATSINNAPTMHGEGNKMRKERKETGERKIKMMIQKAE